MGNDKGFYPGPYWGHADYVGKGENAGTVMNWPIDPEKINPREEVVKAFEALLLKMEEFKPELVLISCGFDGHKEDTLVAGENKTGLQLENEDYLFITRKCVEIANKHGEGKIVSVLEGGYNLKVIGGAAVVHVQGLMEP